MSDLGALHARAKALNLHGLLAHWVEAIAGGWVEALLDWEEQERARRSEVTQAKWEHVEWEKHALLVPASKPANCAQRGYHRLAAISAT